MLPEVVPPDTVVLYQFPRNKKAPSLSPFAIKVFFFSSEF
jgi:hypothetical protein